jgi:thioredoxin 1
MGVSQSSELDDRPDHGIRHVANLDEFNAALKEAEACDSLVVVDYNAEWCGPCRRIAPRFAALASEFRDTIFLNVDVDQAHEVAALYGITTIPTFHAFRAGQLVDQARGANPFAMRSIVVKNQPQPRTNQRAAAPKPQ